MHQIGELSLSSAMFGRLGDPNGQNNALAQVLYGLALRHGWGVEQEPEKAIKYLSLAASNSAAIEQAALESGLKKGGAAKGELVLAIYELANCFRHGWGVKKDAVAARQYYETAANLGDTDAMEEAANCYVEGLGGPKDKVRCVLVSYLLSHSIMCALHQYRDRDQARAPAHGLNSQACFCKGALRPPYNLGRNASQLHVKTARLTGRFFNSTKRRNIFGWRKRKATRASAIPGE